MFCPFCGHNIGVVVVFCTSCGRNIQFLADQEDNESLYQDASEEDLIRTYFKEGHTYEVILDFLQTRHNLNLSLSSLKKKLKSLSLYRHKNHSPLPAVRAAIEEELKGPGQHYGYRAMWQTLRQKYSLTVRRQDVMLMLSELDPSGVQQRSQRRLVRRVYHCLGPNHIWHVDGYDKLKPYGLAISGCIDGYSRKVMWLVCGASNNDPGVIASNYKDCVSKFGVVPMRLRTDCGTENGTMVAIHCTLRSEHSDDFAGAKSHMYGSSTANQRIESWWSHFRKQRSQFWMDLLGDLKDGHHFNGSHEHLCLVRFVFLGLLQRDLDECKLMWNTHTIRPVLQSRCPSGRPDVMFHLPHRFGGRDCGFPVRQEELCHFEAERSLSQCGDDDLQAYFEDLQRQSGLTEPSNWTSAVENYLQIKNIANM